MFISFLMVNIYFLSFSSSSFFFFFVFVYYFEILLGLIDNSSCVGVSLD